MGGQACSFDWGWQSPPPSESGTEIPMLTKIMQDERDRSPSTLARVLGCGAMPPHTPRRNDAAGREGFLMRNKSTASFAIIRYNLRTYEPGGVMAIIKGRGKAEVTVGHFESEQSREDQFAGWGYFLERTDLRPGMDPQKATSVRQMRMDICESKARGLTVVNRRG